MKDLPTSFGFRGGQQLLQSSVLSQQ
jgi:hypothetical protein